MKNSQSFNLGHEEDAQKVIQRWEEEIKASGQQAIDFVNKKREELKHSDKFIAIPNEAFTAAYQNMDGYTNQLPKILAYLEKQPKNEDFTLTNETHAALRKIAQQAKEWKKAFRNLKKGWESDAMFFQLNHGMFSTHQVDICDIPRLQDKF